MESLNVLHLSDFHFGNFYHEDPAALAIKIGDILEANARKVDVVVVSGDVFDGRSKSHEKDIENALLFFSKLICQINIKKICPVEFDRNSILFVPGNHDLLRDEENQLKKYDSFIKSFYGANKSSKVSLVDGYNFIYDCPDKKIAILGFNSCRIVREQAKEEDLKWIDSVDLSRFKKDSQSIKTHFKEHFENKKSWDDFGYINTSEMDNVFNELKQAIPTYKDYNLIATFHHHFYPFPEIAKKSPDASFIRNYTDVLDKFQRYKIQLVLHGHKHISIQRAVTDAKYFENPDSIIYVLAAGSIGCKDVYNRSFQWLRVYDRNFNKLADGEKYDFKDEELEREKPFVLPPQKSEERSTAEHLTDTLQSEAAILHQEYKIITDDFEQVIADCDSNKIIEIVGNLITIFPNIKIELRRNPKIIYLLLLAINYRVIFLKKQHGTADKKISELLTRLKKPILDNSGNNTFATKLLDFLSSTENKILDRNYGLIIKNVNASDKVVAAYVSVALFLTDLFLNISKYGQYYFEKEKLNYKINIALEDGHFYDKIPSSSISFEPNIDRREIVINFRCFDPTVHKVAVLIVKEFEMRLNKFEESLKEIKLKFYYIQPKVQPQKYDLENFHFDAYIPTLLPLLTGDNLYKQKEVFIRELVQNAIDATLLRKQLQPDGTFCTEIIIELGTEVRDAKKVKYFKIRDNGIGMSRFTIERYFTSIGRSFYKSEEFDELKKDNKIKYNAISNFGIGFLSSFMVCKEVLVKTRSILSDNDNEGLQIEIPNYDGCFFITESLQDDFGTEITLYSDQRNLFDFKKFKKYINDIFLGIPLVLHVKDSEDESNSYTINDYAQQREIHGMIKKDNVIFYVPFSESDKRAIDISFTELCNSSMQDLPAFGLYVDFTLTKKPAIISANQGLLISEKYMPFKVNKEGNSLFWAVNYPSSFIQLDVAREKVVQLKDGVDLRNVHELLLKQILNFLTTESNALLSCSLASVNKIYTNLKQSLSHSIPDDIFSQTYVIKVIKKINGVELRVAKREELHDNKLIYPELFYFDFERNQESNNLMEILFDLEKLFFTTQESSSISEKLVQDFRVYFNNRMEYVLAGDYKSRVHQFVDMIHHSGRFEHHFIQSYDQDANALLSNSTLELLQTEYDGITRYRIDKKADKGIDSGEKNFERHVAQIIMQIVGLDERTNRPMPLFFWPFNSIKSIVFDSVTVQNFHSFSLSLDFDSIRKYVYEMIAKVDKVKKGKMLKINNKGTGFV